MTKWLASVQSLTEVRQLQHCLPDIVDMKQPAQGALGALDVATVSEIVDWLDGRTASSATIGDLPMQAEIIAPAIKTMAGSGVDYVKVGLFASANLQQCVAALKPVLMQCETPVIAVIFADQHTDLSLLPRLKLAGFQGVMVDTASKDGRGLLDHWSLQTLSEFVEKAASLHMMCGLAGALKLEDIPLLKPLRADYLGFRSALCHNRQRTTALRHELAMQVREAMQQDLSEAV